MPAPVGGPDAGPGADGGPPLGDSGPLDGNAGGGDGGGPGFPGYDGGPGGPGGTGDGGALSDCPLAPPGVPVDSRGCPIARTMPPGSAFPSPAQPVEKIGCACSSAWAPTGRRSPGPDPSVFVLALALLGLARRPRRAR
jgi:hypothetical protein